MYLYVLEWYFEGKVSKSINVGEPLLLPQMHCSEFGQYFEERAVVKRYTKCRTTRVYFVGQIVAKKQKDVLTCARNQGVACGKRRAATNGQNLKS